MPDRDIQRESWDRRHGDLTDAKLDELARELRQVRDQATVAAEEARGAHTQARKTNGRVDRAEDRLQRLDQAMFGDEDGRIGGDTGLAGYIRQQQQLTRLLGAWVVVGLPLVLTLIVWLDGRGG